MLTWLNTLGACGAKEMVGRFGVRAGEKDRDGKVGLMFPCYKTSSDAHVW